MTVPTPIQQRIRIPGREGCVLASYIEGVSFVKLW